MPNTWPEISSVDELNYKGILAQYGQTMEYAQAFEHALKSINILVGVLTRTNVNVMSDEELHMSLLVGSIGPLMVKLRKIFKDLNLALFSSEVERGIDAARKMRNYLAHSYLIENSRVLARQDAQEHLMEELRFFAETFKFMTLSLDKLLSMALEKLGEGTRHEIEEKLGSTLEEVQMNRLRLRIQNYELDQ